MCYGLKIPYAEGQGCRVSGFGFNARVQVQVQGLGLRVEGLGISLAEGLGFAEGSWLTSK